MSSPMRQLARDVTTLNQLQQLTRRHLLGGAGVGIGAMALTHLWPHRQAAADHPRDTSQSNQAKAKSVIYLHMAGSPSQLDLFEHKPALNRYDGKDCPQQYLEGKRFAFIKGVLQDARVDF